MKRYVCSILTALLMLIAVFPCVFGVDSLDLSDSMHLTFESDQEDIKASYGASLTKISGGFGGSSGSLSITNGTDEKGGFFKNGLRLYSGREYLFSVNVKSEELLGNPRVTLFFHYEEENENGEITSSSGTGYQSVRLVNRENVGNGWVRYFNTYTVAETCTTGNGQAKIYSPDCSIDFRGGSANVSFLADDFIVEPVYPAEMVHENNLLLHESFDGTAVALKGMGAAMSLQEAGGMDDSGCISVVPSNGNGGVMLNSALSIIPGAVYKISWFAKASNESAVGKYLAGYFDFSGIKNEDGTTVFSANQNSSYVRNYSKLAMSDAHGTVTALTKDWQYYECIYKPNNWLYSVYSELPATFYTRIFDDLSGQGSGTDCSFLLDEIKIEKLDTPFNGNFSFPFETKGLWNGFQTGSNVSDTWLKGENTQVSAVTADNPYITVVQSANSSNENDLETRGIRQYISRTAGKNYILSFRARAQEAGHTLVPYIKTLNADGTEHSLQLTNADGSLPALSDTWQVFKLKFTESANIGSGMLGFSADSGANTSDFAFDIDDIILKPISPEFTEIPLTGSFEVGKTITAGVTTEGTNSKVRYKVMSSLDNVHFSCISQGLMTQNTISHTITTGNVGTYIRFEFAGIVDGSFAPKVVTESGYISGASLKFTSTSGDSFVQAEAAIHQNQCVGKRIKLIAAAYGKDRELLNISEFCALYDTLTDGKLTVRVEKNTETVMVKAFLWIDETLEPIVHAKVLGGTENAVLPLKVYLIGDSICYDYGTEVTQRVGWGTKFDDSFVSGVTVDNCAVRGESSLTYLYAERNPADESATHRWWHPNKKWDEILTDSTPGDYCLISLGTNDKNYYTGENFTIGCSKEQYRKNLERFINEGREAGLNILFVTPIPAIGVATTFNSISDYAGVMIEVANENNVTVLDLNKKMYDYCMEMGAETAFNTYYCYEMNDSIHINDEGAKLVNSFILEMLEASVSPLKQFINREEQK